MFTEHLNPFIGGLGLAAVFSAEVSTCDAILFMLATSLSQDLYKTLRQPDRERFATALGGPHRSLVGGALGVALAIALPPSVIGALSIFYSLLAVSCSCPSSAASSRRGPAAAKRSPPSPPAYWCAWACKSSTPAAASASSTRPSSARRAAVAFFVSLALPSPRHT
jgi:Na+/proline symporter